MNATSNIWWDGPLILSVLRLVSFEARLAHAEVKKDLLVFRGAFGMRLLLAAEISGLSVFIFMDYQGDRTSPPHSWLVS